MTVVNLRPPCPLGLGSLNGYNNNGCRCRRCRDAVRAYAKEYRDSGGATTNDPTKAHHPTRYTDETIRQVVRQWAAIQRHARHSITPDPAADAVRTHAPALGKALDALYEEYRQT